ncbi:MAG: nucleoside kinase [Myxococcota bacterium]
MVETLRVRIADRELLMPAGSTVQEAISEVYGDDADIVGALLNNHLVSLATTLRGPAEVVPVRPTERDGEAILRRSVAHVLHTVATQDYPELKLEIGQALVGGWYYEVRTASNVAPDLDRLAAELTRRVRALAETRVPFETRVLAVEEAEKILADPHGHKKKLLRVWPSPSVVVARLNGFVDIQHGPYAPDTGCARHATVVPYPPGIVLQVQPQPAYRPLRAGAHLFATYRETRRWNQRVGVETVGDLNAAILEGRLEDVARVSEALHEKKIAQIADEIAARREHVRLICIAGPSSSGKTTFVRRLSVQLQVNGIDPVLLSLDDYYLSREETPRDDKGELDFETIDALNLPLIHEQLEALLAGDEVRTPRFDFVHGRPTDRDSWKPLRLRERQVLVIEGIHGLNPRLTASVVEQAKYRVFVSALTQLVIDEHNRIFTSDARLLRRIVRDRLYRGTSAADTLARWASVRLGEERHIFPHQENCDVMFNSTLVYEAAVLRTFAWRFLIEVERSHPSRARAYQLLKFLELFVPVFPDCVPANSILREFVGGSGFNY